MDNPAAPVPSTPAQPAIQPEVSTLAGSPSRRWLLWLAGGLALLVFGAAFGVFGVKILNQSPTQSQISSYEDCLAVKGSIIQESYPATCVTASGQRFVQPLTDEEKQGLQPPDLYREPAGSAATARWKTYTNEEFGYSISYPPNVYLRYQCPDEELLLQRRKDIGGIIRNSDDPVISTTICGRDFRYPLEIATHPKAVYTLEIPKSNSDYSVNKTQITINGISANKYEATWIAKDESPAPLWYIKIFVNKNNKTYEIFFNDKQNTAIFDQILSTFHFLK